VHLDVADDALVARLTARRQCPECRHIYNLLSQPPHVFGQCDECHAPLLIRDDDCEAVIRRRLVAYKELTGPILQWYGKSAVHTVDGDMAPEKVRTAIEAAVVDALHTAPVHN
jgi:adenylate kinase